MPSRPIFDDWGWRMKKLWGAPWWCAHQGGGFPTLEPQTVRDRGTTQLPHSNPCVWNLLNFTIKSLWMAACTFAKIFPNSCQKLFISHCIDHRLSPLPTLCMAGVKSIKTQDGKLTKKWNARRLKPKLCNVPEQLWPVIGFARKLVLVFGGTSQVTPTLARGKGILPYLWMTSRLIKLREFR